MSESAKRAGSLVRRLFRGAAATPPRLIPGEERLITGGNAPLIAELAAFVDAAVPDLCLMGVALAYRRAVEQS